jgi:alginate O-acetyltransferase complex protein AlgJ
MVLLLAVGFWQGAAALISPESRIRLTQVLNPSAILAGRTAAAINLVMSHDLPADPALRAAGGILRWGLFRSGGPQVEVGCRNWLFLTEEMRPWPGAETAMRDRADIVRRVAEQLRLHGIGLRVVVVPDKARVQSGDLCGLRYSTQARDRYADFNALLQERSVQHVDLLQPFLAAQAARPLYYRTDTHWNQEGAHLGAQLVAGQIGKELGAAVFHTSAAVDTVQRAGDLLRLMSLDKVPDTIGFRLRPAPDTELTEHTTEVKAPAAGSLLDDGPAIEAVLLGSSFSMNANFAGRLQQELGMPVSIFARLGGGFAGSASQYFAGIAFHDTPPRLVIWEFPERVLGQPLGDDEAKLSALMSSYAEKAKSAAPVRLNAVQHAAQSPGDR